MTASNKNSSYKGPLYDMHCHPGFSSQPLSLLNKAHELGIGGFINVVVPEEFEKLRCVCSGYEQTFAFGAGFHPWWVSGDENWEQHADEVCHQIEQMAKGQQHGQSNDQELWPVYVGEIGLDTNPRFETSFENQKQAFVSIVETALSVDKSVLSIHSVKSATQVLDCLENLGALGAKDCRIVFHWFSGTSEELQRALAAGCYFSINKRMLASKRGREYARQISAERLLLESDLPGEEDSSFSAEVWREVLEETLYQLAQVKGQDVCELAAVIATTSQGLLGKK